MISVHISDLVRATSLSLFGSSKHLTPMRKLNRYPASAITITITITCDSSSPHPFEMA